MPPTAVRPLALVAIVGGAVFVVLGVVQLASPGQADPFSGTSDYLIALPAALGLVASGLMAFAVVRRLVTPQ